MRAAIEEAKKAGEIEEVPIGAVVTRCGEIISKGYNKRETGKNALRHAEIDAISAACSALHTWRLADCELYVTLEPCPMCAGAIINSRIARVVFGASDPKAGAFGSVVDLTAYPFNHKPVVVSGVLKEDCASLLKEFFIQLRDKKKNLK